MSADFLYDDEAFESDVERTAREWVASEQHRNAVLDAARLAVKQMREYMTAIALARFEHIDQRPLENAATDFLTGLGPEVWWRMVWDLAWDGGPSAVEMARKEAAELSNSYTAPMLPAGGTDV